MEEHVFETKNPKKHLKSGAGTRHLRTRRLSDYGTIGRSELQRRKSKRGERGEAQEPPLTSTSSTYLVGTSARVPSSTCRQDRTTREYVTRFTLQIFSNLKQIFQLEIVEKCLSPDFVRSTTDDWKKIQHMLWIQLKIIRVCTLYDDNNVPCPFGYRGGTTK